jgi:predicted DNA binding protein
MTDRKTAPKKTSSGSLNTSTPKRTHITVPKKQVSKAVKDDLEEVKDYEPMSAVQQAINALSYALDDNSTALTSLENKLSLVLNHHTRTGGDVGPSVVDPDDSSVVTQIRNLTEILGTQTAQALTLIGRLDT